MNNTNDKLLPEGKCSKTGIKYSDAIAELQGIVAECDRYGTRAKMPLPVRVRVLIDAVIECTTRPVDTGVGEALSSFDHHRLYGTRCDELPSELIRTIRQALTAAQVPEQDYNLSDKEQAVLRAAQRKSVTKLDTPSPETVAGLVEALRQIRRYERSLRYFGFGGKVEQVKEALARFDAERGG